MNALVSPMTLEIICPKCEQEVPAQNGSLYWMINELPEDNKVRCPFCERLLTVKLPKDTK